MKYLVCISKAPDTTSKIAFTDGNSKFDENGVQFVVNPYDEWYALVRALEIKESTGGHVTIINVGQGSDDAIIRKALAIGADEAVRIDAEAKDAYYVAMQIAAYAKDNAYDLVLTGKETINYKDTFKPIASFRYSPNKTKDINKYFGRDEYFNSVIVESDEILTGKIKQIKITKVNQNTLFGEISSNLIHKDFAA